MASGIIKNIIYRVGTVTPKSGVESKLDIRQYGKIVTINGYLRNCTLTANTEVGVANFSGVPFPPIVLRLICGVGVQPYDHPADVAYLVISEDGYIGVKSSITGQRSIIFSASYIV